MTRHALWFSIVLLAMLGAEQLRAQEGADSTIVPVVVALSSDLPAGAKAVIVRAPLEQDVILLNRIGANPRQLASALAVLIEIRKAYGDTSAQHMRIVVNSEMMPHRWQGEVAQRAARDLATLRAASPRRVGELGELQAIELPVRAARYAISPLQKVP